MEECVVVGVGVVCCFDRDSLSSPLHIHIVFVVYVGVSVATK